MSYIISVVHSYISYGKLKYCAVNSVENISLTRGNINCLTFLNNHIMFCFLYLRVRCMNLYCN